MNIDKSLYMKEFLELRNNLGSVHNLEAKHILYTNLYNEFLPREIKKKVEEVVEEIEEKTIFLGNKKDDLFEGLPEKGASPEKGALPIEGDDKDDGPIEEELIEEEPIEVEPIEEDVEPIEEEVDDDDKPSNVKPIEEDILDIDLTGGGREFKKIVINPNYVALDN